MKILAHLRNKYRTAVRRLCRGRLRDIVKERTSIICNNCFGARVSQELGYAYASPTVGLFFYYPDYITFVKDLKTYCERPLRFRNESKRGG